MAELETIYSYMREFSTQLGERILEEYPALQSFEDPVSLRLDTLLRRPFPAQNIAIMSVAKRWEQFRTALIVAECGTGKTLISLSAIHVHSQGKPYTALAMVPPHLVANGRAKPCLQTSMDFSLSLRQIQSEPGEFILHEGRTSDLPSSRGVLGDS